MNVPTMHRFSRKRRAIKKLWLGIGLLSAALVIIFYVWPYSNHLSSKDYADIERRMGVVYQGMQINDVDTSRYCYHYQDGEGDPKILTCSIGMAGYIDVKDNEDLPAIAEKFAQHLRPLSMSSSDEIWNRQGGPYSHKSPFRSGVLRVKGKMYMSCLVYVKSGYDAGNVGNGLPKRNTTGKAALVLSCGGASREAYFKVQ